MIISSKTAVVGAVMLSLMSSCESTTPEPTPTVAPKVVEEAKPVSTPPVVDPPKAPEVGEVSTAGAMLSWSREGTELSYKLRYEASSACYSAGPSTTEVEQPGNVVKVKAQVAFTDAICAQVITVVSFDGTVEVKGPFEISALITNMRNGDEVTLTAP